MTTATLRNRIKKTVDQVPQERLTLLADFAAFLVTASLRERIAKAERQLAKRKGTNWRTVRRDV